MTFIEDALQELKLHLLAKFAASGRRTQINRNNASQHAQ